MTERNIYQMMQQAESQLQALINTMVAIKQMLKGFETHLADGYNTFYIGDSNDAPLQPEDQQRRIQDHEVRRGPQP